MTAEQIPEDLVQELQGVHLRDLGPHTCQALYRKLEQAVLQPEVKVALLGNTTLDLLVPYVAVACAREGITTEVHASAIDQPILSILDEASSLHRFGPDVILLHLSLLALRPQKVAAYSSLAASERRELRDEVLAEVDGWIAKAKTHTSATLLISNFPVPGFLQAGIGDANIDYGELEFYTDLNLQLLRRLSGDSRAHLFDLDRLAARYGKERAFDARMYYLAKIELGARIAPIVSAELARHIRAFSGRTKKCLVLDADGTLWGGVVSEDGPFGICLGPGDPEGEAFKDFQYRLKALKERGVLLAVASRNNPEDVAEVFKMNKHMVLKTTDFAEMAVNWRPKHENLASLARSLNIGTDSLVFIDNSPVECAMVSEFMPEVVTVLLPDDPAEYVAVLDGLTVFEKTFILDDDRRKTSQYHTARRRSLELARYVDLETFLRKLDTRARIWEAGSEDLSRLHELFSKTNQFNLTTTRYSLAELEGMIMDARVQVGIVGVNDKYGDLGRVASYILRLDGEVLLDSFLVSCRALGRGLETAVMNAIKETFRSSHFSTLNASFIPSGRNAPAEGFLESQGFSLVDTGDDSRRRYRLLREAAAAKPADWIAVERD